MVRSHHLGIVPDKRTSPNFTSKHWDYGLDYPKVRFSNGIHNPDKSGFWIPTVSVIKIQMQGQDSTSLNLSFQLVNAH